MATRLYRCNPQDNDHTVTETAGSATTARIELTIDWDTMISDGLSGQQARMQAMLALEKIAAYIETLGKYSVNA
jgi:hypothetical protein